MFKYLKYLLLFCIAIVFALLFMFNILFVFIIIQEQEQGNDSQHGETDDFFQSTTVSGGPASHAQQSIRRRGGISAEHVSEEEATSYVKKVSV